MENKPRTPVLWLHGLECTCCTEAFIRSAHPLAKDVVLSMISLDYDDTLMAAAGHQAEELLEELLVKYKGQYILAVEGNPPLNEDGMFCIQSGKPFIEKLKHVAKDAKAIIAWGSCASWGCVQAAKPMHYAQMQVYMHLGELERALYYAVNKDTDETHLERVAYDRAFAEKLIEKAQRIISAESPPQRLSNDPAWWGCKFCPFHEHCHWTRFPEANCRTCVHSTPVANAQWECASKKRTLTLAQQRQGCEEHLVIPPMLDRIGEPIDSTEKSVTYKLADGRTLTNGQGGQSSHQLHMLGLENATAPELLDARKKSGKTPRLLKQDT
jgi:hypothetical protein